MEAWEAWWRRWNGYDTCSLWLVRFLRDWIESGLVDIAVVMRISRGHVVCVVVSKTRR